MNSEETLKREFDGEEGSFILKLRCDLDWDKKAFGNLVSIMYDSAEKYKGKESIPTWMAHGFWFFDTWVCEWTSHPDFPRPEKEYYENSIELIHDLAYYLFIGESPYEDDTLKKLSKG